MPSGDAKATFEDGLKQGFSWQNIGKSLATGVVSGIASWAVGKLLDVWFGNTGRSIPELLDDFKAQLESDLRQIIGDELIQAFDNELFRTVKNEARTVAEDFKVAASVGDAYGLDLCFRTATMAKQSAASLGPLGFGVYFTVLDL